jgi:hypothetical protein
VERRSQHQGPAEQPLLRQERAAQRVERQSRRQAPVVLRVAQQAPSRPAREALQPLEGPPVLAQRAQ